MTTTQNGRAVKPETLEALDKLEQEALAQLEQGNTESENQEANGEQTPNSESAPEVIKPLEDTENPSDNESDEAVQTDPKSESPVEDDKPKEKVETPKPSNDGDDDLTEDEVKQLSEKAQRRYRNLVKERDEANAKAEFLSKFAPKEKTEVDKPKPEKKSSTLPWEQDESDDGGDRVLTEAEFDEKVASKSRETVQDELKKQTILHNVVADTRSAETKYPELNPESPEFDGVLGTKITTWYKQLWEKNKDLRLIDFVDEVMDLRTQAAERAQKALDGKIAKQSAEQALTPTNGKPMVTADAEDKIKNATSLAELEAAAKDIRKS